MVNELATNAIKHAFPSGKGSILIRLQKQGHAICLSVSDDGVGLRAAAAMTRNKRGFGSRYVSMFVRQVGGTLNQSSSALGSSFDIRLPLSVIAV
jgi:two-component sensor histidine kinase